MKISSLLDFGTDPIKIDRYMTVSVPPGVWQLKFMTTSPPLLFPSFFFLYLLWTALLQALQKYYINFTHSPHPCFYGKSKGSFNPSLSYRDRWTSKIARLSLFFTYKSDGGAFNYPGSDFTELLIGSVHFHFNLCASMIW